MPSTFNSSAFGTIIITSNLVTFNGYSFMQELKYMQQVTEEASKQQQSRLNNMQEEITAQSQANTMLKTELEAW